jgi:hypothetical protein
MVERTRLRAGLLAAAVWAGAAAAATSARDARACGGCFHPPSMSGTVVTDHRMIFSVSPAQTTLYDQIKYQGSPSDFAWVLPIKSTVTVGVSSDVLFEALDQATQTTISAPNLPPCPSCSRSAGAGFAGAPPLNASLMAPQVTVLSMSVVGPYEQVQLQSTSPTALSAWLGAHGYMIPANVQPVIAAYVSEGFDFLAIRLQPGQGVQAMRPISVTTPGAGLALPLRMVAAGTGATVGITLWVIATGRYEPANFKTFTIAGSELTWDFNTNVSDYATVRSAKEAAMKNAGWQIESSLDLSPYQVENTVLASPDAGADYLPTSPGASAGDGGAADGAVDDASAGAALTADQVRVKDLATCFPGGTATVRVTRMRADLSRAALASDLALRAASDQSSLSNYYQAAMSKNAPTCPPYNPFACGPGGFFGGGSGSSSGCAVAAIEPRGAGLEIGLAGLLGAALVGARRRLLTALAARGRRAGRRLLRRR